MKLDIRDQTALFDIKGNREIWLNMTIPDLPSPPEKPNTLSVCNGNEIYWVGRKHFLFRTSLEEEDYWQRTFRDIEKNGLIVQSRVSDIYNFLAFRGENVITELATFTSLDLENLGDTSCCFSQALGLQALFIRRDYGFEIAFEHCYLEMIQEQFAPYW